jgi:ABC-type multidrug transport system ATPase subunit
VGNQVAQSSHAAPPLLVRTLRNTHRLDSGREYRIGRDESADIPLSDARASWNHAVIRAEGPVWVLEDAGSRNGTFLGNQRVNRMEITGPCVVHFGHPEDGPVMSFELAPVPERPPAPAPAPAPQGYGQPQGHGAGFGGGGAAAGDTTFMPGVLREPTSRIRIQQSQVIKIGRRPDNDVVVSDLGVSKTHAELRRSPTGQFSIIDLGSHNGTYVNGARVNQAELREEDIIAIGHSTFRLVGGELIEYVDDGRATFEAHDLSVVVTSNGKPKVLLDGITFPLAARSMMAVIGPAGAGKSTLLNALTGKNQATTGNVFYDFRDLYDNYDELRHRIGLVPQDSVIHDQLTAQSALGYAAKLRFSPDTMAEERNARVTRVLGELSMTEHKDKPIHNLSGGQNKRVNIGLELLTSPSLLFLDEPTSPLDPHLKRDMFALMRKMADKDAEDGQSVVVITHDVGSDLIDQCDRLLVLQPGGKMAFFGPPGDGLRYFGANDWADVFQKFAAEPQRDFAAEYRASPEYVKYVATPISVASQRTERRPDDAPKPKQISTFNQMTTLARRYLRVMVADKVFLATTVLMPMLLGVLVRSTPDSLGLTNGIGKLAGTNTAAIQVLMILVMSCVLSGTALSIREIIKEREIYRRERMAGESPIAYLFSKIVVLSVISIGQTLLVVLVGLLGAKVPPKGVVIPVNALVEIFVALALLGVVSMLLGLAVSCLVSKGDQTMPILVGVTMVQVALSGGLFPVSGKGLAVIASLSPSRWGLGALASTINLNQIQAVETMVVPGGLPPTAKPDALWTGDASHWLTAMGVLLLIGAFWTLIAWYRLAKIGPGRRR